MGSCRPACSLTLLCNFSSYVMVVVTSASVFFCVFLSVVGVFFRLWVLLLKVDLISEPPRELEPIREQTWKA